MATKLKTDKKGKKNFKYDLETGKMGPIFYLLPVPKRQTHPVSKSSEDKNCYLHSPCNKASGLFTR